MERDKTISDNKSIIVYLVGTFIVTYIFWGLIILANSKGLLLYGSREYFIVFILGGISPTVFGYIVSKKNGHIKSLFILVKEYFNIKQNILYYAFLLIFLVFSFITPAIYGKTYSLLYPWYFIFLFLLKMVFFGGLEEIGWRYTIQPIFERHFSFIVSSLFVSILWSLWHLPLFFIEGMNKGMNFELFFISVIGMSFSLGAIHYVSKSLWLCVLFHALVNALSQLISVNSDINTVILSTIFRIIFSLFLVYVVQGKNSKQNINEKNS